MSVPPLMTMRRTRLNPGEASDAPPATSEPVELPQQPPAQTRANRRQNATQAADKKAKTVVSKKAPAKATSTKKGARKNKSKNIVAEEEEIAAESAAGPMDVDEEELTSLPPPNRPSVSPASPLTMLPPRSPSPSSRTDKSVLNMLHEPAIAESPLKHPANRSNVKEAPKAAEDEALPDADTSSKADALVLHSSGNPQPPPKLGTVQVRIEGEELEEYNPNEVERRAPTAQEFQASRSKFSDLEHIFGGIASERLDWCKIPESWELGSGAPSTEVKERLEAVAQASAFLVASIAADAGISKAVAWKHTGLLRFESRQANPYNLFCKARAPAIREENGGKSIGDAKETNKILSAEWKGMNEEKRQLLTDHLRHEAMKSEQGVMKDNLVTLQQRRAFVREQADALTSLGVQLNVQSDVQVLGMVVLPPTDNVESVSSYFTSSISGITAVKRHDRELRSIIQTVIKGSMTGAGGQNLGEIKHQPQDAKEIQKWNKDEAVLEATWRMRQIQTETAPWQEKRPSKDTVAWTDALLLNIKARCMLGGWISDEVYPGSQHDSRKGRPRSSLLKDLGLVGGRAFVQKYDKDRNPDDKKPDRLKLRYYLIDDLSVDDSGSLVPTADLSPAALLTVHPLKDYPKHLQPLIADKYGHIIVSVGDASKHQRTLGDAEDVLTNERGDELLPDLTRVEDCAPLFQALQEKVSKDLKKIAEKKPSTSRKRKRAPKSSKTIEIVSEDEEEDEDNDEGEGKNKRRKKLSPPASSDEDST